MNRKPFGPGCELYTLRNPNGIEVALSNFGATLVSLKVPDRSSKGSQGLVDLVLGYRTYDEYVADRAYLGATVGRFANRIAHGRFKIGSSTYTLAQNDNGNSLHGGISGFNKRLWKTDEMVTESARPSVAFELLSPDGDEGFPGNLRVKVRFNLSAENELKIDYEASTDRDTVLNLTQHSYFNLAGEGSGQVLDHEISICADHFTPVDRTLIPTGELRPVEGSPFDLRSPIRIGDRISEDLPQDEQLRICGGYDHNWVLGDGPGLKLAARARDPRSGRGLEVLTTEPGIQLYTGNFLDGSIAGKSGRAYGRRHGFTLETQHFPDSPNQAGFPTTLLRADQVYRSTTVYRITGLEP